MAVKLPSAECSVCHGRFAIRKTGQVRYHYSGPSNNRYECEGGGEMPVPGTQEGAYSYG